MSVLLTSSNAWRVLKIAFAVEPACLATVKRLFTMVSTKSIGGLNINREIEDDHQTSAYLICAAASSSVTVIVIVDDEFSSWVFARTGGSADGANSINGVGSASGATVEKDTLERLSLSLKKQSTRRRKRMNIFGTRTDEVLQFGISRSTDEARSVGSSCERTKLD